MVTISDILKDIERGCTANNLKEECFSYRLVYFVNEGNTLAVFIKFINFFGLCSPFPVFSEGAHSE